MSLSNGLAALIGFACEAVLWGTNCTLFVTALVILSRRRSQQGLHNPIVYLTCVIFFSCTTHFALEFYHYCTSLNAVGVANFSDETTHLVGADFLISFTDFLCDLVLVYRCWILWAPNYAVILLPILTAVSGFACIIGVIVLLFEIDPASPSPPSQLVPLGLAGYILPLATNIMITFLIVYRIWSSSCTVAGSPLEIGRGVTHRAMILIIESGGLYLLFQLVFVILFAVGSPAEGILAVMTVQIYGIAPTLIIIRVGLGSSLPSGAVMSTGLKWMAREGSANLTTSDTDGFATHTDIERMKDSDLSGPEQRELDRSV